MDLVCDCLYEIRARYKFVLSLVSRVIEGIGRLLRFLSMSVFLCPAPCLVALPRSSVGVDLMARFAGCRTPKRFTPTPLLSFGRWHLA